MSTPVIVCNTKNIAGLDIIGKLGYCMDNKNINFKLPCFKLESKMVYYVKDSIILRRGMDQKVIKILPRNISVDDIINEILNCQEGIGLDKCVIWLSEDSLSIKEFFNNKTLEK